MSKDCTKYELEIAAAAGAELPREVSDHLSGCAHCAELRADALTLAGGRGPSHTPAAALALARSALEKRKASKTAPLWGAPLVSASASAAALILYFGLAAAPASTTVQLDTTPEPENASTDEAVESDFTPRLPNLAELPLPDSFEASHDMLLVGSSGRDES